MRLKDKVAIVTGAASGIGKEIAIVYAREGAKVAIADLNKSAADATAAELRSDGGQAMGVAMDVTDERAVSAGVAAVVAAFGGVDVLVSNAGIQIWKSFPSLNGKRCWPSTSMALSLPRARACHTCTRRAVAASSIWDRCIQKRPRLSKRLTSRLSTD